MIVNSAALLKIKNNYFDQLSQIKKQCRQKIDLLKQAKDVVRLTSFDYPLVFDYVAQKFPSVNIHAATVFICNLNVFEVVFPELSDVGILGFYDRISKAVVIPQMLSVKISPDEVVVRQLPLPKGRGFPPPTRMNCCIMCRMLEDTHLQAGSLRKNLPMVIRLIIFEAKAGKTKI